MSASRLLLVCGAAEDGELWDAVTRQARRATHVVELPPLADPDALADAVAADVRPTDVVVGHSLGGAVATLLAARGVTAAGWVVVACGAALPVHESIWTVLREDGPWAVARQLSVAAAGGRRALAAPEAAALAERTERMFARRADHLAAHLTACATFRCPEGAIENAEILGGTRDQMVVAPLVRDLAERVGARLTVLDAAHQIPWEAPAAVLAAADRATSH